MSNGTVRYFIIALIALLLADWTQPLLLQACTLSPAMAKVQPRADGFVESIHSFAVGDAVAKGAPLADITVPAWAADQSEYLLLKSQHAPRDIINGVREKMRLAGMPEEMLAAVDKTGRVQTRLTLKAPVAGIITALNVYPGMNVSKEMVVAVIQGADPVWITADVPESDVHLLLGKNRLRLAVQAYPDRVFMAENVTLLPKANQDTRTVPLRMTVANPEGLLKPGMISTGVKSPIGIRVSGPDTAAVDKAAVEVQNLAKTVPGVTSALAESLTGGRYFDVNINRRQAARYGMSASSILPLRLSTIVSIASPTSENSA